MPTFSPGTVNYPGEPAEVNVTFPDIIYRDVSRDQANFECATIHPNYGEQEKFEIQF